MTQNKLKIAITGGIGSGKSAVSRLIADLGYQVFSCDEIYKKLLTQKDFIDKLAEEFGDIKDKNGYIDKSKLSEIVFSDNEKLERLNEITHPEIMKEALSEMYGVGIAFCEVPLLFECGLESYFDDVIVVLRNADERISAVVKRDNLSSEQVKLRIKSQFDYDNKQFKKYYVIHNNTDLDNLRIKTAEIIKKIVKQKN